MNKAPGPLAILLSLVWDVGLSLGAYFVAHWLGASDYLALLAGSAAALLRLLYVALKARKLDVFAGFMLGVFLFGFAMSFLSGDARFLLIKESFGTGIVGLAFLGSLFLGRPLIYHAALRGKVGKPEEVAEFEHKWATLPGFRRTFRIMTGVWGGGLLAEALVRIPLVYLLDTSVAVTVSSVLFIGTMVALSLWSGMYAKRVQARAAAAAAAAETDTANA
ncbi:hypothetical protein GCM10010174_13140 [Kutzneria viridogrisea]|uniref:Uncharacterized protein n=2 Tax=Kutzneria TaxID=43356 RepID=W5WKI7_9PSEU|nr:VC0807 family protein [Kutzneria albida]AHI01082.1 hypothetical protein KALB_7724 [Kutzneria albida DSM 43870]MBA8926337.1 intracellular septation protein A [Kutzneria viridogrisea]